MPTRENILKERALTEQDDLSKHIYYILTDAGSIKIQRVAKTLGLLIGHLRKNGILSDKDIDDMLLEVVSGSAALRNKARVQTKNPANRYGFTPNPD